MQLDFIGDGPRDEAVIPKLVKTALPNAEKRTFLAWKDIRLARGSGYERKLRFAITAAGDAGVAGIIAIVDCDRSTPGTQLAKLCAARLAHRQSTVETQIKVAIGEAIPHVEAWLLDDAKATRDCFRLDAEVEVPNVRKCDPKETIHALKAQSSRDESELELLTEIAGELRGSRCAHRGETGFELFVADLRDEFR